MVIQSLIELLAPVECLGCGRDGRVLCDDCIRNYTLAKPYDGFEQDVPSPALRGFYVGAFYDGPIKELILKLKFYRMRSAAEACAELVLASLPEGLVVDVVTSVPVAPARYRERGYNQAALVAKVVARRLGRRHSPLLARMGAVHQLGQDRVTRLDQIHGVFYAVRLLEGQRVLVVDDVATTGATLAECAEVLVGAGAGEVWGAAVARH